MAIDIQKLFNNDIPAAMARNPGGAQAIGAKYQINITGDGGGEWFVDASSSGPKCVSDNPGGADLTVTIENVDFQHYYDNPQSNGPQLFFAGRIRTSGHPQLFMQMYKLFQL